MREKVGSTKKSLGRLELVGRRKLDRLRASERGLAALSRSHTRLVEKDMKVQFRRLANAIKPGVDLSKALHREGPDSPLAGLAKDMKRDSPVTVAATVGGASAGEREVFEGMALTKGPPFLSSQALEAPEARASRPAPLGGGIVALRHFVPDRGILSIGTGISYFYGAPPTGQLQLPGIPFPLQASTEQITIRQPMILPSPLGRSASVSVTATLEVVGALSEGAFTALTPGDAGGAGAGLVGALGFVSISLFAAGRSPAVINTVKFLDERADRSGMSYPWRFLPAFAVTVWTDLGPEDSRVDVWVQAQVTSFRAGGVDDTSPATAFVSFIPFGDAPYLPTPLPPPNGTTLFLRKIALRCPSAREALTGVATSF